MANVEKSSIALTPEMAAIVRQYVKSGEYASSGHVSWRHPGAGGK